MRVTIDTNVFVYALDARDGLKQRTAISVITACRRLDCAVGLQVYGEMFAVLTRRFARLAPEAAQAVRAVIAQFNSFPSSETAVDRALAEAVAGRFSYWDALLLAAADEAGREICFSEDMHDGARLGAVTVVNPFAPSGVSAAAALALGIS
jgi:predicted nucleic acid-binding protein